MGVRRRVGVKHELHDPRPIAQVDEDQTPVVAAPMHPARDPRQRIRALTGHLAAPGVAVQVRARARASRQPASPEDRRDHLAGLELVLLA